MTQDYKMLQEKSKQFADLFEYSLIEYKGIFDFYNSPMFHSFRFEVDPETFSCYDIIYFLYKKFEGRLCQ
jgi:hypothetical protein